MTPNDDKTYLIATIAAVAFAGTLALIAWMAAS